MRNRMQRLIAAVLVGLLGSGHKNRHRRLRPSSLSLFL